MEQDHQEAMKLCRELNGNKRRKPVAPPRTMETRASKKAHIDSHMTVVTPAKPNQSTLLSDPTLSLISPPITNSSSPTGNETYILSPTKPIPSAPVDNNTYITFTSPLSISSFVDALIQEESVSISGCKPVITTHVGQNFDGTWFTSSSTTTNFQVSAQEKGIRKTRSARRVKSTSSTEYLAGDGDDCGISNALVQQNARRVKKRKAHDDELSFRESHSSPEPMEDAAEVFEKKPDRKRKSSTKVTAGTRKAKLPLYHENVQEGKPDPIGQPEVWAFKRQQLCETLPYYNAYQSGAYTHDGIARSIMIDKEVSIRDQFDDEIVITSV